MDVTFFILKKCSKPHNKIIYWYYGNTASCFRRISKLENDNPVCQCADMLSSLSDCKSAEQLSVLANILALLISNNKDADQLNVIGNFIVGVGSLILTIAAQKESCKSTQDKLKQISDLKKQLKELEGSL